MPFVQALPAAGCRCVLGNENRMSPHRRLFAVVGDLCRGQSFGDKVFGVFADNRRSFLPYIQYFGRPQPETATKIRPV